MRGCKIGNGDGSDVSFLALRGRLISRCVGYATHYRMENIDTKAHRGILGKILQFRKFNPFFPSPPVLKHAHAPGTV
jgi:hypothetical protein